MVGCSSSLEGHPQIIISIYTKYIPSISPPFSSHPWSLLLLHQFLLQITFPPNIITSLATLWQSSRSYHLSIVTIQFIFLLTDYQLLGSYGAALEKHRTFFYYHFVHSNSQPWLRVHHKTTWTAPPPLGLDQLMSKSFNSLPSNEVFTVLSSTQFQLERILMNENWIDMMDYWWNISTKMAEPYWSAYNVAPKFPAMDLA